MKLLKSSVLTVCVSLLMSLTVFSQEANKTVYYKSKYMKKETKAETPYLRKFQLKDNKVTVLLVKDHMLYEKVVVYPFSKLKKAEDFYFDSSKKKYEGKSYEYTSYNQVNKIVETGIEVKGKRKVNQVTFKGEELLTDGSGILEYVDKRDQTKFKVVYKNHSHASKERVLTSGDTLMWVNNQHQRSEAIFKDGMKSLYEKLNQDIHHSDFKIDETTKIYVKFIVDSNGKVKKDPRHEYSDVETYILSKVEQAGEWKPCTLNNQPYASDLILPLTFHK
ncbi:hypothetical protein [Flammeovirga aprica]|uniref:TonB C-terminal domain-containing protein n=1 Tax=Flammeovirga aprica JL-4 TaxID=694437 RepID=A0A7X9NZ80_9BACT|nr:hypothetical protein [Flammeovirga aprica]NME66636.1 hypothetical protein [Flammeovirga aprica JL-4]